MFSTQIKTPGPAAWSARRRRPCEGGSPVVLLALVGEPAWMNDQALAAGGREPVDAPHQVVDRFLVSRRVGRAEVDAAGADGLATPAAVPAL